jgi:hypothetical protein
VAAQVQEVVEYYATDGVGSVRVVLNASGQVVARADYQPFLFASGNSRRSSSPDSRGTGFEGRTG